MLQKALEESKREMEAKKGGVCERSLKYEQFVTSIIVQTLLYSVVTHLAVTSYYNLLNWIMLIQL